MHGIVDQFYNEGFATLFYHKPANYLCDKIKNKTAKRIVFAVIKTLYTVLMIALVSKLVYDEYFAG